eukprot:g5277.t1
MWDDYVWIVVVGSFLAFFTAYGIGANDVANAFATSVGSKAITIPQAVIIAGIFEFAGAVLLGAQVTDTVRKKIADRDEFEDDPEVLMYGMLCVLAATGLWLTLASFLELPVSTTHSVIGGIIGMALAAKGSDAVVWYKYDEDKSSLKKFSGVAPVIASWVISPFLSGCFAVILFYGVRTLILRKEDSEQRAYLFFPILVGLTVAINVYFIIFKGFSRKIEHDGEKRKLKSILGGWSHFVAWGSGSISALIVAVAVVPRLRNKIAQTKAQRLSSIKAAEEGSGGGNNKQYITEASPQQEGGLLRMITNKIPTHDVHAVIQEDNTVNTIHETTERFDADTEEVFKYLQVFTATCDSFAHGANDVANSIGPFASIFMIYRKESASSKASVPEWILVLGGAGIVLGLATYGYNIIRAIGVKLIKVTASRGFAIELGAAIVIIIGSQYGIPLSTTHCQVGATVGVGLLEGTSGVNLALLFKVIGGWLITLVVVGFTAAGFFAQGAYAPSILNLRSMNRYEEGLLETLKILDGTGVRLDSVTNLTATIEEFQEDKTDDSRAQIELLLEWARAVRDQCNVV